MAIKYRMWANYNKFIILNLIWRKLTENAISGSKLAHLAIVKFIPEATIANRMAILNLNIFNFKIINSLIKFAHPAQDGTIRNIFK